MTNRLNNRSLIERPSPINDAQHAFDSIRNICNLCFKEPGKVTFHGRRIVEETKTEVFFERLLFPIGEKCLYVYDNCKECKITYAQKDLNATVSAEVVCKHCVSDYFQCDSCGDYEHNRRKNTYRDHEGNELGFCNTCYNENFMECRLCGGWHPSETFSEIIYNENDMDVCQECNTNVRECVVCDGHYMSWAQARMEDGTRCCESCSRNERDANRIVHQYSFSPTTFVNRFMPDEDTRLTPTYGLELEFETDEDCEEAEQIAGALVEKFDPSKKFFYFKEDGSLSDGGLELVTHPWSRRFHTESDMWNGVLYDMRKIHGCVSYNNSNCGIHIHRSRKDLSKMTQTKLGLFIHEQQEFIEIIAQRNSSGYSKFNSKGRYKKKNVRHGAKYSAINFRTGRGTIELRVFKGSLALNTVKAYVEFYDALCSYVKLASVVDICRSDGYKMFLSFAKKFRRTYPELFKYLIRRKVCEPKKYGAKAKKKTWIRHTTREV